MKKILIIGATSAIAEATARLFAKNGERLYLLARNEQYLESLAKDLRIRGAESVSWDLLDVNHFDSHESTLTKALETLEGIDTVLIAHGTLPDQKACEHDIQLTLKEFNTNAMSTISMLTYLANRMEQQRHGTLAVITSVAGDRGRQSNYVYGAAKGAVALFLQGLRNRLHKSSVQVLTIKPGLVDSPMTKHFKKGLLWASPETIAQGILMSIKNQKSVSYLPGFWYGIMFIIKWIPENIFKRLFL